MTATAASSPALAGGRNRRRRAYNTLALLLALGLMGVVYSAFAPRSSAGTQVSQAQMASEGRAIYLQGCSTCHGIQAQGTQIAPSLIGVGGAATYFQVSTGRMPLAAQGAQADGNSNGKQVLYGQGDTLRLSAYIQTFGGPDVPKVDLQSADLALGGELFRTNCASCHNFAGSGGALTYGKYAPNLHNIGATGIASAMLSGPENMPVFSNTQLDKAERDSIAKYVLAVTKAPGQGGNTLSKSGPVAEGLVAWVAGIGLLLGFTLWIGNKA